MLLKQGKGNAKYITAVAVLQGVSALVAAKTDSVGRQSSSWHGNTVLNSLKYVVAAYLQPQYLVLSAGPNTHIDR